MTTSTNAERQAGADAPRVIDRRFELPTDRARTWRTLTEPAELRGWLKATVELPPKTGATGWFEWVAGRRYALRVEACEPDRRIAYRWARDANTPLDAGPSTLVDWRLEDGQGSRSVVTLRESGFLDEASLDDSTLGWFNSLVDLARHVATEPWQHPIQRTLQLAADRGRVWRALTDPAELQAWWGGMTDAFRAEPGYEGWFAFEEHGRHAVRIEAADAPRYLAWRWAPGQPETPLSTASEITLVQWVLHPRAGGGTELHLAETGFTGPRKFTDNSEGWDEILPLLVKELETTRA